MASRSDNNGEYRDLNTVTELERIILDRKAHPQEGSYTCSLFDKGLEEIVKKVGEETIEVIVAATGQSDERLTEEAADLIYHLLVLLVERGLTWDDVEAELAKRRK
jgi:phosphoribosyl-ATP pyrophosphohydrolase